MTRSISASSIHLEMVIVHLGASLLAFLSASSQHPTGATQYFLMGEERDTNLFNVDRLHQLFPLSLKPFLRETLAIDYILEEVRYGQRNNWLDFGCDTITVFIMRLLETVIDNMVQGYSKRCMFESWYFLSLSICILMKDNNFIMTCNICSGNTDEKLACLLMCINYLDLFA